MTHLRRAGVRTSLLVALLIAASGTVSATGSTFAKGVDVEQTKRLVIDIEARRCAAVAARDFDGLASLLADDYIHVLGNGTPLSKSEYVASVRATPRVPTRGELTVRVYGDVAVITGDFNNRMQTPGQPERVVEAYATQVIRKVDGKWKFESFQHSQKQEAPASPPQPHTK